MAVTASRIAVGATAVALNTATAAATTLTIRNDSSYFAVVLGPATVTATNGYALRGGEQVSIPLITNDVVFAIAGSGTDFANVSVIKSA